MATWIGFCTYLHVPDLNRHELTVEIFAESDIFRVWQSFGSDGSMLAPHTPFLCSLVSLSIHHPVKTRTLSTMSS